MNKIKISNPKISLINCINNPPNPTSNNMLSIEDSGANLHIAKQATSYMSPVIMSTEMTARLTYGITVESLHIATHQILGLRKQARQIHIFHKLRQPH